MAIEQKDQTHYVKGLYTHEGDEVWLKGEKVVRLQASIDDMGTSFLDVDPLGVLQGTGEPGIGSRIRLTEEGIRLSVGANTSIDLNRAAGITLRFGASTLMLNEDGLNIIVGPYILRLTPTGLEAVVGDNVLALTPAGLTVDGNVIELAGVATCSIDAPTIELTAGNLSIEAGLTEVM